MGIYMPEIIVRKVLHLQQRYPTVGDWWFDPEEEYSGGALQIKVSIMGNDHYETLVAIHEIIEAILCKSRGISESDVTAFDVQYESDRDKGLHEETSEPGNDPAAPYYREHQFATKVERLIADELGVDWDEYDKAVNTL